MWCIVFSGILVTCIMPIRVIAATNNVIPETLYIITNTYIYEDADSTSEFLGVIKCGNMVNSFGYENHMYKVEYDGISGYIKEEDVGTTFEEYTASLSETDENFKVKDIIIAQDGTEPILPTTHFVEKFGDAENAAMSLYTCNQDFSDDYMIVNDSSSISIGGYLINAAYQNGTPSITVAYTTDGITRDVSIKIPSFETADENIYNMSFSYSDDTLTFAENGDFPQGFEIGFAKDNISVMQKGTLLESTTDEEGITWISTNNRNPVTVSEKKEDATLTEVKKYMKNNVSEDVEDVSKTSNKMKSWYIPVMTIVATVALVIGIIGKRKVRRYKGNGIHRRRKKK